MLTQLERIDDRGTVEEILAPRSFVAKGAGSLSFSGRSSLARSAWQSPSFYIGLVLMVLILAATQLICLAMAMRGRISA